MVNMFIEIPERLLSIIPDACGLVITFIYWCITYSKNKQGEITKLDNWMHNNIANILFVYTFTLIIFKSIKSAVFMSFSQLENFISLQWAIFGITITIFVVWNAVVLDPLKKRKPVMADKKTTINKNRYIAEKLDFYRESSLKFFSVTVVIVNLFVLLFATSSIYVISNESNLINQNLIVASFYFCSSALICVISDILQPLLKEKKSMLSETKVDSSEIMQLNEIQDTMAYAITLCAEIASIPDIPEEAISISSMDLLSLVTESELSPEEIKIKLKEKQNNYLKMFAKQGDANDQL